MGDFDRLGIRTKLCLISKSFCRVCSQTLCFLSKSGEGRVCGKAASDGEYRKIYDIKLVG